jgi:glycosyltransferase involved in cell wall biosynthesis
MPDEIFHLAGGRELPWPILRIVNERGEDTEFCALRGPVARSAVQPSLERFIREHRVIGICSRGVFPGHDPLRDDVHGRSGGVESIRSYHYVERTEGWAHCFRRPELYLPPGLPTVLLSESDFKDPDWVWQVGCQEGQPPKHWDVIYVGAPGMHNEFIKNMALGMASIYWLCSELGIRALAVGCTVTGQAEVQNGQLEVTGQLPWHELMECLARSRIALFPNSLDASPRLIAEAMCLDVPVLVSRDILGGWKYVTPDTGEFFDTEVDAVQVVRTMLGTSYSPRAWFVANHGPVNAGRRLAEFLESLA